MGLASQVLRTCKPCKEQGIKGNKYMKRANELFRGDLTDRELGIIEDALETYTNELGDDLRAIEATKLITKLYKFWEVK